MLIWLWAITALILLSALTFVVPALWVRVEGLGLSAPQKSTYSIIAALAFIVFCYGAYSYLGVGPQLSMYYSKQNQELRQNYVKIRPLYGKLQRALIKNELDLVIDLDSVDIILHFAQAHSQTQEGFLEPQVINLLSAVLKAIPRQVTALNLLAVNSYKREKYAQAIEYWQAILQQFPAKMKNSHAEQVLRSKITETQARLSLLESS